MCGAEQERKVVWTRGRGRTMQPCSHAAMRRRSGCRIVTPAGGAATPHLSGVPTPRVNGSVFCEAVRSGLRRSGMLLTWRDARPRRPPERERCSWVGGPLRIGARSTKWEGKAFSVLGLKKKGRFAAGSVACEIVVAGRLTIRKESLGGMGRDRLPGGLVRRWQFWGLLELKQGYKI